jgi:hypothetical protein
MTLNHLSNVNVVFKTVPLERPGLVEKRAKKQEKRLTMGSKGANR